MRVSPKQAFFISALSRAWLILISLVVASTTVAAAAEPRTDYTHVLRVQISVEFDGERIDFDDLVFCGVRVKGTLTTRPAIQVLPTRWTITRVLKDGGMLGFRVSWRVCSLVQHRWRPGVTEDKEYKAPESFLPLFYWVDTADPATRTKGEAYRSEGYFKAPYARLKILSPMTFTVPVHPPTNRLLAEAFAQEDAEKEREFEAPLRGDSGIVPVTEEEWRNTDFYLERFDRIRPRLERPQMERFVAYLDSISPEMGLVMLHSKDNFWMQGPLGELFRGKSPSTKDLMEYGIPQKGVKDLGMLGYTNPPEWRFRRADDVIPMICDGDGVVRPTIRLRGMKFLRRGVCSKYGFAEWIEIDGLRYPWNGDAFPFFYDPRSKTIYRAE